MKNSLKLVLMTFIASLFLTQVFTAQQSRVRQR